MLNRKYKLKKNNDFKRVFNKGQYNQQGFLRMKFLKNELDVSRFAFMVGQKIAKKAVARNRIKRHLEEAVRLMCHQIKQGFDIIIMPSSAIAEKNYQEIQDNLLALFKQTGLIRS